MKTPEQIINDSHLSTEDKGTLLEAVRDSARFLRIAKACVASDVQLCQFDDGVWRPLAEPLGQVRLMADGIPHVEEDA